MRRAAMLLSWQGMIYPVWLVVGLSLGLGSSLAMAEQAATPSDSAWQQAVEKVIESYIRSHPEVIEQTLQALEAKRQEEEKARVKTVVAARQNELVNDPASPVSGNSKGEVTVVEFFDYRCGFCKRAAGAVTKLQKDDPRVRVIYKNFPILGEASELAAKAALASNAQGRYQQFHEALLAAKADLTKEQVLHIASDVGLDTKKLETDMDNPEWSTVIERNRELARDLGITGTPAFVVGNELYPGAMELAALKELVARAQASTPDNVRSVPSKAGEDSSVPR